MANLSHLPRRAGPRKLHGSSKQLFWNIAGAARDGGGGDGGAHLVVNLLAALQRGGQQRQQAVGARLRVAGQVGQNRLTLGLDVGQSPARTLEGKDTGETMREKPT